MEKEEIDYSVKIQNFITMTENNNQEIALNYLQKANWDETVNYDILTFHRKP